MNQKLMIGFVIIGLLVVCGVSGVLGFFGIKQAAGNVQAQGCDLLANKTEQDSCYFNAAQTSHDNSYCTKIGNQTMRNECARK